MGRLCPGGFAGVDVFFVISGYLITGGILSDLEKRQFTLRNFYHRRIRRILPAYFTLIAGVFVTGCAVYYSLPLIHLGDATVMGTIFSANLYFWKLGGDYFAPDVHENPLLHLWSLSVEEQFYLCIPLLCCALWAFRRRWIAPVFTGIAVLSFLGACYAIATGRQGSAFYLLSYRAWELLAGSLLAMLPAVRSRGATGWSTGSEPGKDSPTGHGACSRASAALRRSVDGPAPMLAVAGLLMVLFPYGLLSSTTPFPGVAALSSVTGTALLIRHGQNAWINGLLAWRPFVAIGRISYSLYLWHWPVMVFWRYSTYDQLGLLDYFGMLALSVVLAYLSWRFVEVRVRTSSAWTPRLSFAFATAGIFVLVGIGTCCVFQKGWPTVLHPEANRLTNERPRFVESLIRNRLRQIKLGLGFSLPFDDFVPFALGGGGDFGLGTRGRPPEVVLIGDSHAGALQYGLDVVLHEQNRGGYAMSRGATAMFDLRSDESRHAFEWLSKHPTISTVILAQRWRLYNTAAAIAQLEEFSLRMRALGKTLYVATDVPSYKKAPSDIAARLRIIPPRGKDSLVEGLWQNEKEYDRLEEAINRELTEVCGRTGAYIIPLNMALKQNDRYIAFAEENGRTIPLYSDYNHLSPAGSLRAARFLMPYLTSARQLFPASAAEPESRAESSKPRL